MTEAKEGKDLTELILEEPRVGVFICHCGSNIAGTLDIDSLEEYAKSLPDVVYVKQNRYTCADPGQDEIRKGIEEFNLNRVVVAACSPRMHEPTFRVTVEEGGLNRYLFIMANIREHCSWCHPETPESLVKAQEIIRMAVAKVRLTEPLERFEVPVTNKALVIGGGVSGIHSALDLANMGFKTYILEKAESIGGHMAQLDKTFPTLDCSICIEGPKMVETGRHENIEIISYSDLISVEGFIGNFKVKIRKNPRYVIPENCTGCGECMDVCPVEYPNSWEQNLGTRKAISVPFPQAVPLVYTINRDHCIECYKCVDMCGDRAAINFEQEPEEVEIEVGTIIVSTGYHAMYEPTHGADTTLPEKGSTYYGYGEYENVVTAMEIERLVCAGGPTGGQVIRRSDGGHPHRVGFIQCVGSRDENMYEYCSNFCCMYTLKNGILIKEHEPDTEIYIFYMDMRTFGKGFEEFYHRARDMGFTFIRGRPSKVVEDPETKNLIVTVEDINLGEVIEVELDLLILSTAAEPNADTDELGGKLHITRSADGFFMESHPKLKPLDTPLDGVFLSGACQGPKDIPYSVTAGSGAAARAATILSKDKVFIEPIVAEIDPNKCKNVERDCGVCVDKCPYSAITALEGQAAIVQVANCHGCGTCVASCPHDAITQKHFTDEMIFSQIRAALEEDAEEKILVIACNWCCYGGSDLAGTSRFQYPPNVRIIRVMCSGRVDTDFVADAFRLGAGAVMVGACHLPTDCHYIRGNWVAKERIERYAKVLEGAGISPQRFIWKEISAAEGLIFQQTMIKINQDLKDLGIDKIKEENEKAKKRITAPLKRKSLIPEDA